MDAADGPKAPHLDEAARAAEGPGAAAPPWLARTAGVLSVLRAERARVSLLALGGLCLGLLGSLVLPRWYEASAEFAIMPVDDPTLPAAGSAAEGAGAALPLFSHLLRSRQVLDAVVERLRLAPSPEEGRRELLRHVTVLSDRKSGVVRLTVEARDPERARLLAATIGELASARSVEVWSARAREHRQRLEARRDELGAALRGAEDALRAFREREHIIDLPEQLKASVAEAVQLERTRIERRMGSAFARGFAGQGAAEVQREELQAQGAQAALSHLGEPGDKGPGGRGPLLPLQALPRLEVEHARLKRDVELQAASHDLVARQVEQLRTLEARPAGRPEIVDAPAAPRRPSRPSLVMLATAGLLLGLVLGLALAFLRAVLRHHGPRLRDALAPPSPLSPP